MTEMRAEELDQCFSSHNSRIHPVWEQSLLSTVIPAASLPSKGVLTNHLKHQGMDSLKTSSLAPLICHEMEEGILSNDSKGKSEREGKRKIVLCLDLVIKICFVDLR